MKPIDSDEFKEIALNLLRSFITVAEKFNLRYFLDFGTLLGAIRHNGFIPWDDDIDISMPRKDYERLIEIAKQEKNLFGQNYKLAHYNQLEYSVQKGYLNLVDMRTITCSPYRLEKYRYPIWIDIFPQDFCYNDLEVTESIRKKVLKIQQKIRESMCPVNGPLSTLRNLYRRLQQPFIEKRFLQIEDILKQIPESDMVTSYYGEVPCYMDIHMFDNFEYHDFEGVQCRIPCDYDRRLKERYGNYMELPPENERVGHVMEAYWL